MDDTLVDRVMKFEIGASDAKLSFTGRLCREQGWTRAYAARVIVEYKRFMLLAVAAGHPVTPSEAVDHVWHLHLLYTRSYWHDFCRDTLGQEVHHGPTLGGLQEKEKFVDWYQNTLDSYERMFGQAPPQDIWPPQQKRFQFAGDWKVYNAGTHFLVPRWRQILKCFRIC